MEYSELLVTFSLLYEQVNSATTDAITRGAFINLAAKNITNRFKWTWRALPVSTTLDGTNSFTLPDDFSNDGFVKDSVYIDDELWTEINIDEQNMYSSDSQVYYVTGDIKGGYTIHFPKSVPDDVSVFEYSYYRTHPDLVDDTDETFIPDGESICNLAVGRFLKSEGEGDEAVTWLQDAENGIVDMRNADRRKQPVRRVQKQTRTGVDQFSVDKMY